LILSAHGFGCALFMGDFVSEQFGGSREGKGE
jgi:hypothetical protein